MVPPDSGGLARLVDRFAALEVIGVVESTTGARFVHDQLELASWNVRLADARKV